MARLKARDKWGGVISCDLINCAVLGCGKKIKDLHHYDYKRETEVVALCKEHHRSFHLNWTEK